MLGAKQTAFCHEYIKDRNATQAAIRAGYSEKTAGQMGFENLKKPEIILRIKELEDEVRAKNVASAHEVEAYLTSVLRGESESEIVVVEGEGDGVSSARRMKKAPDEKERLKAAELLGKRHGLFTEKLEIASEVVIVDDTGTDED